MSICFIHKTNGNIYVPIFHTANNQASDQTLILILYYSHIKDCCPMQSQTYSWSLIAIKSILYQDIIITKMTTYNNPSHFQENLQQF